VTRTLDQLLDATRTRTAVDWALPAGTLEWSVAATVDHLVEVCTWYSIQLACAATAYTPLDARPPVHATNTDRTRALSAAGALFETVLGAVPADRRAWHFFGMADVDRFRAMGLAELLVHGHDITAGLGVAWRPDDSTVRGVLCRLFLATVIDDDPMAPAAVGTRTTRASRPSSGHDLGLAHRPDRAGEPAPAH